MKSFGFIYNPNSGSNSPKRLAALKQHATQLPGSTVRSAASKEGIAKLVEYLRASHDAIVACGGDGTIREVAKPLIGTDTPLGIIPLGSGNDLAKSLRIPKSIDDALSILTSGRIKRIDTGRCNDFIFINTLGFGFDALTNRYSYDYQMFNGIFRYIIAVFKANNKRDYVNVTIKDRTTSSHHNVIMVTLANGKVEGGSFWIAPEASLTNGKLELITIDPVSRWKLLLYMPLILIKKVQLVPKYTIRSIRQVQLTFDRAVAIHADGEIINSQSWHFTISVIPESLRVFC